MILDMKHVVIRLAYRGIVPVGHAAGARIHCAHGRIWITEHGGAGDIVLEAGQCYEISHSGGAVVQALRESVVTLSGASAPQARPGLAARLARFWASPAGRPASGHA